MTSFDTISKFLRDCSSVKPLRPGGVIQFTDIANDVPLSEQASCSVESWIGGLGGARPIGAWCRMLTDAGFVDVAIGPPIDAYCGALGESVARRWGVHAHFFLAYKPW